MYLNAVVFNISKNENSQVCLFYYKLKFFNLVWTRFTFHNVTWLYYACHETSISVSVFDMTIYVTCINLHLCVCIICKFIFKGCYFRSLSCSLYSWWGFGNKQCHMICKQFSPICLFLHKHIFYCTRGRPFYLFIFIARTRSQTRTNFTIVGSTESSRMRPLSKYKAIKAIHTH